MKYINGTIVCLCMLLFSCAPEEEGPATGNVKAGKVEVLADNLEPLQMDDHTKVNRVKVTLRNTGEKAHIAYQVKLVQGRETWTDTLQVYIGTGDTLKGELIFPRSLYIPEKPATFTSSLHILN